MVFITSIMEAKLFSSINIESFWNEVISLDQSFGSFIYALRLTLSGSDSFISNRFQITIKVIKWSFMYIYVDDGFHLV